jgi:hypothetical protein
MSTDRPHRRPPSSPVTRQPAPGADPIAAIASQLAAGELTAHEAVSRVLDAALGVAAAAPEPVRAQLRAELTALLWTDPGLAAAAQRLGALPAPGEDG